MKPVELNGLTRREIGVMVPEQRVFDGTFPEGFRGETDLAKLVRAHDAAGNFDAHHERVATLALRVDPDPLESLDLAGHCGERVDPFLRVPRDDRLGDLEGVAAQLEQLLLIEFADVAIRIEKGHGGLAGTVEVEAVRVILGGSRRAHASPLWATRDVAAGERSGDRPGNVKSGCTI